MKVILSFLLAAFSLSANAQKFSSIKDRVNAAKTVAPGTQTGTLIDYTIAVINSPQPNQLTPGTALTINFKVRPDDDMDIKAAYINFVADGAAYDQPEYVTAEKAVYITEPMSCYKPLIDLIERSIDRTAGTVKRLKLTFAKDPGGKTSALIYVQSLNF